MFVFPLLYIFLFILSLRNLANRKLNGIILFIVFGLPIYTIALSVSNMYGFTKFIPILQTFKEVSILCYLIYLIIHINRKIHFHIIDKLMLFFFFYTMIYVFLPLGTYGFFQRVLAFKSLCFFPVVYFTGRMMNVRKINLSEVFHYIFLLSILASCVLLYEIIINTHLQTFSGYADYISRFFDQDPTGNYGLSWTFQIENGMKRFASFFSTPLDFATATLITISALAAFVTNEKNKIHFNNFTALTLFSTLFAIIFALSRASFVSYFIIIYTYAVITNNKLIRQVIHYAILAVMIFILFVTIKGDFFEFIMNTILFKNESSAGHVIEWLNGIQSMILHPLGIGLGESGRISAFTGLNTGGENEFVIIGVQVGVIALATYIIIYAKMVSTAYTMVKERKGKTRKLGIFIILIKMGLLIPLFTAEIESYIYISYLVWFLSGLFMSIVSEKVPAEHRIALINSTVYS